MFKEYLKRFVIYFLILINVIILPNLVLSQENKTENDVRIKDIQLMHIEKYKNKLNELNLNEQKKSPLGSISDWGSMGSANFINYGPYDVGIGLIYLQLLFIQSGWNLTLELKDSNWNVVASSTNPNNDDEEISYTTTGNGTYYITVSVAGSGSGDGDYYLTGTYPDPSLSGPDLIISDMWVNYDQQFVNNNVSVGIEVENIGTATAIWSSYVGLYTNPTSPPVVCDTPDYFRNINYLDPNNSQIITFNNVTSSAAEEWVMYAFIDFLNIEPELDENNNASDPPVAMEWFEEPITDNYGWPFSNSSTTRQINSIFDEYRYRSTHNPPHYFHDGIDVQATNTDIYTVSSGEVYSFSYNNQGYRNGVYIGNSFYYHIENFQSYIVEGDLIHVNELIADTDSENHLHFNDGLNHFEVNPLRTDGIAPQANTEAPTIYEVTFVTNQQSSHTPTMPATNLSGEVDIVARVSGNSSWRMGIYKLSYQVDAQNPVENMIFDWWISANSRDYCYYDPAGDSHRYRITNLPESDLSWNTANSGSGNHVVWVKAEDTYGNPTEVPISVIITGGNAIGDDNTAEIPKKFDLNKNYPNPFNNQTVIPYQTARGSNVNITVHNLLGQKIRDIITGYRTPGYYNAVWNGKNNSGKTVASGLYIVRMSASKDGETYYVSSNKINLLK